MVLLPEPDAPTRATASPGPQIEGDVVHRPHAAGPPAPARDEGLAQAAHRAARARRRRGRRSDGRGSGAGVSKAPSSCAGVGVAGCSCRSARAGAVSTSLPWCRTPTRAQRARVRARSWLMNRTAKPRLACSFEDVGQDLAGQDHVERGGRLVQDQQRRGAGPGPWRSPPAGASRPTARGRSRRPPAGGRPTCWHSSRARSRAAGRATGSWARMASAIWRAIGSSGLRAFMPLWGTRDDLPPAHRQQLPVRQGEQIAPAQQDAAARDHRRRQQQAQQGLGQGRLAAARFADQAEHLAGGHLERDAVDRPHRPGVEQVVDRQVVDRRAPSASAIGRSATTGVGGVGAGRPPAPPAGRPARAAGAGCRARRGRC